jgi:hypothetical protein
MKGPQQLVFGEFKLEQVWQQIELHTSKVNLKIMSKVSNMLNDETFLDQLMTTADEEDEKPKKSKNLKKDVDYKFEKADVKDDISADYGSEAEQAEEGEEELDQAPESADESDMDRLMQGMEEDELQADELKMPSDLEGDDEESEDEGIFGDGGPIDDGQDDYDEEVPKKKQKLLESDAEDDVENVFEMATHNKENDLVEQM